jgi:ABC-type multidrug transport system permease subunit
MPGIVTNATSLPIIRRERSAGTYSASAAYLAKFLSSIPLTIIGSLILALPVYWMIGFQNDAGRYLTFIVIVVVHSFVAMSLGIMIGSGIKNVRVGQVIGPLIVVLFLIFGGQLLNLDSIPVVFKWIQWISIISYSNKALNQNEFPGLVFNCEPGGPCYKTGEQILEIFAFTNPQGVWVCVGINLALALAFISIGYVLFRSTSKPLMRLK